MSPQLNGTLPSPYQDVLAFHQKFGLLTHHEPTHLTYRKLNERLEFLQEELIELRDACVAQSLAGQADALVDLVYVALGTAAMLGLPWEMLWADVHRANMAKVRGVGKRGHLVDCVKPLGWEPPRTLAILEAAGYDQADQAKIHLHRDDPEHEGGSDER